MGTSCSRKAGNEGKSGAFPGGKNGGGGKCNPTSRHGAGGAGFTENGMISNVSGEFSYVCALSFRNGGTGGSFRANFSQNPQDGGFGGGGAGGWAGSGGGGGFSGGGAGDNQQNAAAAGGGGSFNAGTEQKSRVNWEGDGQITITFLGNFQKFESSSLLSSTQTNDSTTNNKTG